MVKKQLFIIVGLICVALGSIGVVVPLLPTTPFLLLALYLFMRSSDKMYKWVMNNKVLAPYVISYFSSGGIPRKIVFRSILILWITILISIIIFAQNVYIRVILVIVAVLVSIHIYSKRVKNSTNEKDFN